LEAVEEALEAVEAVDVEAALEAVDVVAALEAVEVVEALEAVEAVEVVAALEVVEVLPVVEVPQAAIEAAIIPASANTTTFLPKFFIIIIIFSFRKPICFRFL